MNKLLIVILTFFLFQELNAQVIQLGTGNTINTVTQAAPTNIYYRRQVSQFVYTAAELNAAGATVANVLSQIGFFITNEPVNAIPGYTIKIKHTNQTNVNSALGTTGWTTVKNAFSYSPTPGGYDMIVLDTPFNWDGVQNLGVEICWSQVQPNYDPSGQVRIYTATNGYRYSRNDNAGSICGTSPATRVNYKPQAQLTFQTTATWNGSVNTDWFNDNNWNIGTPDKELDAIIPSSASTMPIISSSGAECKNLQINSGASLTVSGSNNLDIYKNWTNNGTFVPNTGTVTLKGRVTNQINGATNQSLHNLSIDNKSGAAIASGSINLHGTLNISNATGSFNTNNSLTVVSDANGTGRINELTNKCIYTLNMSDTYGDSWNGAFVSVLIDGVLEGEYFALGSNSTNVFVAPTGSTVQLNYTAGLYEYENSYILYDAAGTAVFSDGTTPATGSNVFNTTPSCSFFNPISGNITMQRHIPAGTTTWRYLTSAISGTTIADFSDDFLTTGFIGSNFPPSPANPTPFVSIYTYNEPTPGIIDSGFVHATNVTNPLAVGQGMWAWIDGNQATNIDVVGPPNVGDINIPISYTNNGTPSQDGWNLIGNPYPSSINWDSPGITKTNINNAVYIWDGNSQQYASYVNGIGANGGSRNIPSSQAFWIQANSPGPSLQLTEASKSVTDAAFLRPAASIAPLRIKTQNTFGSDEIVINFEPAASANFDGAYDAKKIASSNPSLPKSSSILNGIEYSINQMNPQEINIPIKILTGVTSNHTISIENAHDFNPSSCLILEDLFTGVSHNLSLVDSFSTVIYDTTQTARFLLHIGAPIDVEVNDISCYDNNDAKIVFSKNSSNPFNIIWKDHSNTIISSSTNVISTDSITNLGTGVYYIETTDALCGNNIDTIIINQPNQITAQFSSNLDTTYLSNGGMVNFTNQSNNATSFNWDFDDFNTSNLNSPNHQYTVAGEYLVTLKAEQSIDCFQTFSKEIVVLDIPTAISENSSNKKVKAWINNNTLLIKNTQKANISIRNVVGQVLFNENGKNNHAFDLSKISSQMLIINIYDNLNTAPIKINFIKK